jgi:hypothetical protein
MAYPLFQTVNCVDGQRDAADVADLVGGEEQDDVADVDGGDVDIHLSQPHGVTSGLPAGSLGDERDLARETTRHTTHTPHIRRV